MLLELDLALRREARRGAGASARRSPSSGSVRSRKSSGPRRQTRTRRDHPRLRRQQQRGTSSPRRDVVREHPLEVVLRVRPGDPHVGAGRRATPRTETLTTLVSLGSVPLFRSKAEAEGRRGRLRPGAPPARPVPDREVARAARRLGARRSTSRRGRSTISGEVERPLTLTWEQLLELPSREVTVDIHCVTRWSRFDTTFKGVHWSELAKLVAPKPSARFVVAHAEQGFTSNIPLDGDRGRERADRLRGRRRAAHAPTTAGRSA